MTNQSFYRCPTCAYAPLEHGSDGLICPNGHFFGFSTGTKVPVFACEPEGSNEYSCDDAAVVHDNSLRWVFSTFKTGEKELRERLIARMRLSKGMRVLITGAGAGNDLPYLARALSGKGEIHALDIAKEMLLAGVERHEADLASADLKLFFTIGDATTLPFNDAFFDAAYHFGGINLFPDIAKGISEMNRVVKPGGKIVIGDEGLAPWLIDTELGRMLIKNNALYACSAPMTFVPETARSVRLTWELCNTFYVIEFEASQEPLPIDIDVPHIGKRGGSIRSRYFGQLEGVSPELRDRVYQEAERRNVSRVDFLESALRAWLSNKD